MISLRGAGIAGFDLASRKCGWCWGNGASVPEAGAILLPQVDNDLGFMLDEFDQRLNALIDRSWITVAVYEAPILRPANDKLLTIRKLYALGAHLEFVCRRRGIECREESLRVIKRELAGTTKADKDAMVRAALKCGVKLPETLADGREDAADAFGAWLVGVRHYAKAYSDAWDRRLWSSRGALI